MIYIPLPDEETRVQVLAACLRDSPVAPEVDLGFLAAHTSGFSGADLMEICQRAAKVAVHESIQLEAEGLGADGAAPVPFITGRHFEAAMATARCSVSAADARWYAAVAAAAADGRPLPDRPDREEDLESLQEQLREKIEEVKELSRVQRAWAMARKQVTEIREDAAAA